jgi:hypothetical protein
VRHGWFTQIDPIGLAGGLNLYGFAGGDPVNFSDPFGLCKQKDQECHILVAMLRSQRGSAFSTAAAQYDRLQQGDVHFIAKSQLGPISREQGVLGVSSVGKDSDVWLVGQQSREDFLLTAVHEALHLEGLVHGQEFVQRMYDAYMQLSEEEQVRAVNTAAWLHKWTAGQVPAPAATPEKEDQ